MHFFKDGHETTVSRFYEPGGNAISPEDLRAINRRVLNTRGDLLFSRCVVLFEGETEEQALPQFAEYYWGKHPNEVGVTFVGVGGSGNYHPFIRLTTRFRIPWVIFSDGDAKAIAEVNNVLAEVGEPSVDDNPRCFVIADGNDFESYLFTPTSQAAIRQMIAEFAVECAGTTNEKAVAALTKKCLDKTDEEVLAELRKYKTAYGARIARALRTLPKVEDQVPEMLRLALDTALQGRNIREDN